MQKETLQMIIKMLENATSKDVTRFHLGNVEITPNLMSATDGHILSQCKFYDEALNGVKKIHIHRDEIPFLKTILRKSPYGIIIGVDVTETEMRIEGKKVSSDEIRYPDVNQFIPKDDDGFEIAFNPELLLKLANSMNSDKKNKSVKLKIKDKVSPIKVYIDGNLGVLMPMRF